MIRQQYKFPLFFLILICSHNSIAQTSNNFFINSDKLNEQVYIDCISANMSKEFAQIKDELKKELVNRGYLNFVFNNFQIDSIKEKNALNYYLDVNEGEQSYIGKINTTTNETLDNQFFQKHFSDLEGELFFESKLNTFIDELLIKLENRGYPFAKISINSLYFDSLQNGNSVVDVYLHVETEKERKIDNVEIIGNTKTSEKVIINAARLKKGEIYSQKRINDIPLELNKLRFFHDVKIPKYLVDSEENGILQITIKEKNTNSFDGIIGYVPAANSGGDGYFTGFVNISLRNLFGSGRGASIKWEQENSLTQELELKYLEPWIFNYPLNLNVQFFQRKQDSSYVKRLFGGSLEFLATNDISAAVIVETESIIPSLNSANLGILNSTSLNTGIQLKIDSRDNIYSPQSGFIFTSTYKYRLRSVDENENLPSNISNRDLEYHNYELDFGIFYSLVKDQVFAIGVHAKEVISDYYDLSDLFHLGGTNTLRGYRERQFVGNRIIWSNLEYRFLLSNSSFLFTFFDGGYYLVNADKNNNIKRKSDFKNGYGLGISLDTALGIMKVSYAFAEGTSISNGLIHFGLLNDF